MKLQDIILYVGIHGMKFGYALALIVSTHAILHNGLGNFSQLRIGPKGLICIWVGLILMGISRLIDKAMQ